MLVNSILSADPNNQSESHPDKSQYYEDDKQYESVFDPKPPLAGA